MMESNLLLEQYGKFKKAELEESPFRCLLFCRPVSPPAKESATAKYYSNFCAKFPTAGPLMAGPPLCGFLLR